MLALGTKAPRFRLPDVVSGREIATEDYQDKAALLVMFICRHCPYVVHVLPELVRLGNDYSRKEVGIVAISSNDADSYPEDAPHRLKEMAVSSGFAFPLCYDLSQEIARAYGAACTPDFFLFDHAQALVYRGQLDDTRPGKGAPDGRDLRAALDALLGGRPISSDQKPSVGCGIKWKRGQPRG